MAQGLLFGKCTASTDNISPYAEALRFNSIRLGVKFKLQVDNSHSCNNYSMNKQAYLYTVLR